MLDLIILSPWQDRKTSLTSFHSFFFFFTSFHSRLNRRRLLCIKAGWSADVVAESLGEDINSVAVISLSFSSRVQGADIQFLRAEQASR